MACLGLSHNAQAFVPGDRFVSRSILPLRSNRKQDRYGDTQGASRMTNRRLDAQDVIQRRNKRRRIVIVLRQCAK